MHGNAWCGFIVLNISEYLAEREHSTEVKDDQIARNSTEANVETGPFVDAGNCCDTTQFSWTFFLGQHSTTVSSDEYAYCIPNPKHTPKYTKAKVPHTQYKYIQLSSFTWLCCYPIKSLAAASPPEYIDTHSLLTGYPRPKELDTSERGCKPAVVHETLCRTDVL